MTTTVLAPERSLDQRRDALRLANEIRVKRSRLKRDLKAGRASLTEVIANPPSYLKTAKVWDLLLATPKLGRVKVGRTLNRCQISPSKTVGGLSRRQRDELLEVVGSR